MDFRIADTFTASLARLPAQEQKAVKMSAFDMQLDPAGLGLQFHRIDTAKDPNFWSVRVNRDIRIRDAIKRWLDHRLRFVRSLAHVASILCDRASIDLLDHIEKPRRPSVVE